MLREEKFCDYAISSAQRRIYVLNKIAGVSTVYNMPSILRMKKKYNINEIEAAFRKVIARHESLRTAFFIEQGEVVQRVFNEVDFKIEHYILSEKEDIKEIVGKFIRPFSLEEAPLLRVAILEKYDRQHLLLDMHHIISDGRSENILMNDFYAFAGGEELLPLPCQYRDCSKREISFRSNEKYMKRAREFWLDVFSDINEALQLPTDFPRTEVQQFDGDRKVFAADKVLTKQVQDICEEYKVTMNHFLLTIYAITLSKLSNQEDVVIGTPVSSRSNSEEEQVIGLFLNTLPIRIYPKADKSFLELLNEVKRFSLMAMKYQNYTLDMLVKEVDFPKDLSRNPVFDVAFLFNSNIVIDAENCENYYRTNNAKVDLSIEVTNSSDQIKFLMEYCTKLYKPETCEKFGNLFLRVLQQVTMNVKIRIGQIEKLTQAEKNQLLYEWNQTDCEYDKHLTINHLLVNQVHKSPYKTALVCENESLTYEEMNNKVNQFAFYLRSRNIGRNDIVAIIMNPKIDMIIAILGVIRAGASYLPIAPNTPEQRVDLILQDSGAKLLVVEKEIEAKRKDNVYTYNAAELSQFSKQIENINQASDLLYVIYTSGSTGNPKGVMVEHRNLVNIRYGISQAVSMDQRKRILFLTTMCFDISVLEMILPLTLGMEVVIAKKEIQNDIRSLLQYIQEKEIDMLQFTPSRFQMLTLIPNWKDKFSKVKTLLIGGEAFPSSLLTKLLDLSNINIFNVYGPTETTIWSTVEKITDLQITIGRPIANTKIYILDKNKQCVGVGEVGEIYIAGDGVARGYCNNKKLTDEKFTENPYTGEIMYATGDLGKWNCAGKIECLGRIDFQVKIRGYRIELDEIEQQIRKYKGVESTVVIDCSDKDENKYLCAYVTGKIEDFHGLKKHLEMQLPEYMIPSFFMKLDKMPLNNNGKINRKMLPKPTIQKAKKVERILSSTALKIENVWKKVLNLSEIDADEDFFDLGGNSLLAIKADLLFEQEKIKITGQNIYQYRTIRRLAEFLDNSIMCKKSVLEPISDRGGDSREKIISYADDSKVIEGIEPYNELFFESCFNNSLFSILNYYGIKISHLLRQYTLHYECVAEQDGMRQIIALGEWNKEMIPILQHAGVRFCSKHNVEHIDIEIKKAIDKGNPVILWIDCFYESYRKDKFQKQHFNHTITVYGYSDSEQKFYILEHKVADNTNYHNVSISYKELMECYQGYLENFKNVEDNDFYEFNARNNAEINSESLSQEEFLDSCWKREPVMEFKEYFEKQEYSKIRMEEITYWIDGMNKVINGLRIDVVKYADHIKLDETKKRLNYWNRLRNNLLRSFYTKKYSKEMHEKNQKFLEDILELEN